MKKVFLITFFLFFSFKVHSLEVTLTQGSVKPTPIAVTELYSKNSQLTKVGKNISTVISDNLERSGLFLPIDKRSFIQDNESLSNKPRFEDWKLIKAQALITGQVKFVDEKLRVEFRLWDVLAAKELMALAFTTVPENWRRVGHIISDKIYERLTGEKGYFDTRIIYVAEEGPKTKRVKKLAIMDQDGANNKFLNDPVVTHP